MVTGDTKVVEQARATAFITTTGVGAGPSVRPAAPMRGRAMRC